MANGITAIPVVPSVLPSTTALTAYNNFAGVSVAAGALLISESVARKDIPLSSLLLALTVALTGGAIGAYILKTSALEPQESIAYKAAMKTI